MNDTVNLSELLLMLLLVGRLGMVVVVMMMMVLAVLLGVELFALLGLLLGLVAMILKPDLHLGENERDERQRRRPFVLGSV